MRAPLALLLAVAFGTSALAESSGRRAGPSYTPAGMAVATNNRPGPFAPNQIVSLYGSDLAYSTEAAGGANIRDNLLPDRLARVQVLVMSGKAGIPVPLLYVSAEQINFVLPDSLDPGEYDIVVAREGTSGPLARIGLQDVAPAFVENPAGIAVATHADGAPVTADSPARPGEVVVLYATGLGPSVLRLRDGEVPAIPPLPLSGLVIKRLAELRVLLAGEAVDASRVLYAGLTPGLAALYQVNVQLPDQLPADPEIRLAIGDIFSPEAVKLPVLP